MGIRKSIQTVSYTHLRSAFDQFDPEKISTYGVEKIEELASNAAIIRNRRKIQAVIRNAQIFLDMRKEWGSFSAYLWHWTDGKTLREIGPTHSPLSDQISKDLYRRGMRFVGTTTVSYTHLATNVGQVALGSMSPEQVEKLEAYWGVNTPPVERYLGWLGSVLQGDFGTSLLYRQPVLTIIGERLGNSIWVLAFAWVFSGLLGMALGVLAGVFRGRLPDRCIRGYCLLISSTPAFWLALLLLLIFSVWLGWLPIGLSVPIGCLLYTSGRWLGSSVSGRH